MTESETPTAPDARRVTAVFDDLLRNPVTTLHRVRAGGGVGQTVVLAVGALLAFVLYGLIAGSFQGASQMLVAAWKVPVIVAFSAFLCAPSLFVFGSLLGASLTPRTFLVVLVGFCAFLGVLLVGLVPIVWLFSASSRSLVFVTWLHVFLGVAAVVLAGRYLRAVLADAGGRGIIVPWLLLFIIVSFQVVTLLRPVLWRADDEPLLPSRAEKLSFFEHLDHVYDFGRPRVLPRPDRLTALDRVVAAERQRAVDTTRQGLTGLLRHVTDDAVAFTPAPGPARSVWPTEVAASPAAPGSVREPRRGDVSDHRDLAWLVGEVRVPVSGGGVRHACFVSLWREGEAEWRLQVDAEIPTPGACAFEQSGFVPVDDTLSNGSWQSNGLEALRHADQRVARLSTEQGTAAGLGGVLREDVQLFRPGRQPIIGRVKGREYLASDAPRLQFTPFGAGLSQDGRLGYTFGRAERTSDGVTDTQYYLRIWRAWPGGDFAIVVDAHVARP